LASVAQGPIERQPIGLDPDLLSSMVKLDGVFWMVRTARNPAI
jgi:hypothetical protein